MEVEDSARWIIRTLGRGATVLMHNTSDADTIGRSLTEFVRCEDVSRFRSMWPSDAANVGAQLPPMHRIWIRCCPREAGLGKRKLSSIAGGDGGLVVDGPDELSEDALSYEQSLYAPVLAYVMQLKSNGRVLILGSTGAPQILGRCGKYGRGRCESTYEFQDALVAVRMQHTLRRPEHFHAISGVDLEIQEMWTVSAKRDFAWCGVFDRIWNFGYNREQLKHMFSSMPPQLREAAEREATAGLTAGVQRLMAMKRRDESNTRRLQESPGDLPIRDPKAVYFSEQSEADVPDPQDGALLGVHYDDVGRRQGFQVTGEFAEMFGLSCYDELLSRTLSCSLPMPATELDMLGIHLYQLEMALSGRTRFSYYQRLFRQNDRTAVLARVDLSYSQGNVTLRCTTVSVAEFDHQLATNPGIVRPYMHAIGDRRRGQELLDSARDDMLRSAVSDLRETPEGRQLLANFASAMDGRVGMTVRSLLRGA